MNNRSFNSVSSFALNKSPNLPSQSSPCLPTSASLIEFSLSPNLVLGGEVCHHFGHPQHGLYKVDLPDRFTCSGCREYGSGKRFTCQLCDFQLHEFCGMVPEQFNAHPLHVYHQLLFSSKPVKGGFYKAKCDVCGKSVKGYAFKCNSCSYQMHPCCAMLSNEFTISVHPHPLRIVPDAAMTVTNGNTAPGFVCGECNKGKRSGRVYRCTVCQYHLHAVCAKNMVNGLPANGIKKSSKIGTVARLASQVIIQLVGKLIEGLGESVGEALIQCDDRGRRHRN